MGFGEAIRVCLKKYVDFFGRARRAEYWWFLLFTILVGIAARILDRFLAGGAPLSNGPVAVITSLALLLPGVAVSVRRLHDIDRTGWWILVFYVALVVLIVMAIAAAFAGSATTALVLLLAACALCLWLIVWFATKGTAGPNRFGPDPLTGDAATNPAPAAA